MTFHHLRTAVLAVLLPGCAVHQASSRPASVEAVVRVRNASMVPLRIRICGDPCSAYVTASPRESIELRIDTSRQSRFVVAAMEGDRLAAQQAFVADSRVLSLTIRPPRIERVPHSGRAAR